MTRLTKNSSLKPPEEKFPESEYEQKRLENLKRNQELLASLELVSTPLPEKKKVKRAPVEKLSTRASRRIQGLAPEKGLLQNLNTQNNSSSAWLRYHHQEGVETNPFVVEGDVSVHDVDLDNKKEATTDDRYWEGLARMTTKVCTNLSPSDILEEKELCDRISRLSLNQAVSPLRTNQERIYSMAVHPTTDKVLLFSGDKQGGISVVDFPASISGTENEDSLENAVKEFRPHSRTVTQLAIHPQFPGKVYSSSYDGALRCLDIEKAIFEQVCFLNDTMYSSFTMNQSGSVVYCSDLDGYATRCDLRVGSDSSKTTSFTLHSRKIGCISLDPENQYSLATCSNDRTLALWDVRKLQPFDNQAVLTFEHGMSVTSGYFSPTASRFVSNCYDDKLRLFPSLILNTNETLPLPILNYHNNQSGRFVTLLRAVWNPNPAFPLIGVGGMKRTIDLYSGLSGDLLVQLQHPNMSAIPAVIAFHPLKNIILGGNASGKVVLWQGQHEDGLE